MKKSALIAFALVLALALLAPAPAAAANEDTAALWKTKCAGCHAADGTGQTPMGKKMNLADLGSPEVQKMTDAQLTEIVTKGKNKMPAYDGKLTADQIKALVAHMRTFK
jgi:mono/diheme cytochrome c family protein